MPRRGHTAAGARGVRAPVCCVRDMQKQRAGHLPAVAGDVRGAPARSAVAVVCGKPPAHRSWARQVLARVDARYFLLGHPRDGGSGAVLAIFARGAHGDRETERAGPRIEPGLKEATPGFSFPHDSDFFCLNKQV